MIHDAAMAVFAMIAALVAVLSGEADGGHAAGMDAVATGAGFVRRVAVVRVAVNADGSVSATSAAVVYASVVADVVRPWIPRSDLAALIGRWRLQPAQLAHDLRLQRHSR